MSVRNLLNFFVVPGSLAHGLAEWYWVRFRSVGIGVYLSCLLGDGECFEINYAFYVCMYVITCLLGDGVDFLGSIAIGFDVGWLRGKQGGERGF